MTKTQKLQAELGMRDIEIAQLKLELLTQKNIAETNYDGFALSVRMYDELKQKYNNVSGLLEDKKERIAELERANELLRGVNEKISKKLKGIPNWIRWIFKYVF